MTGADPQGLSQLRRPTVSVILPFLGGLDEAREVVRSLEALEIAPGDELIVADNTPDSVAEAAAEDSPVLVAIAGDTRSASHARNIGANRATGEWFLFVDDDCVLPADILDRYFEPAPDDRCGIAAGEIVGDPGQRGVLPAWARSRRGKWVRHHLDSGPHPGGITANLLVRRCVWEELGGFQLGGGGDLDLCWRAQDAGWGFEYRPDVVVIHRDRDSVRTLVGQAFSYGSHGRHLQALHGSSVERARLVVPLVRSLASFVSWLSKRQPRQALFSLIDGLWAFFYWLGDRTAGRGARRAD